MNPTSIRPKMGATSVHDYEMSCQFARQLETKDVNERFNIRQFISDVADREPKFIDRFPNLWNEICNDIANLAIGQPLTKPVICGAGYSLDTALRYLRAQS